MEEIQMAKDKDNHGYDQRSNVNEIERTKDSYSITSRESNDAKDNHGYDQRSIERTEDSYSITSRESDDANHEDEKNVRMEEKANHTSDNSYVADEAGVIDKSTAIRTSCNISDATADEQNENKKENETESMYTKYNIDKKLEIEFEEVFETIVETHVETIEELGPVETVYTNQIFIDSVRGDVFDEDCTSPHPHTSNSTNNYNNNINNNYPYSPGLTTPQPGCKTTPCTPSKPGQPQTKMFFTESTSPYTLSPKSGQKPNNYGQDPVVWVDLEGDYVVIDLYSNNIKCRDRNSTSVFMYIQ